jgi:hypothetical protein
MEDSEGWRLEARVEQQGVLVAGQKLGVDGEGVDRNLDTGWIKAPAGG